MKLCLLLGVLPLAAVAQTPALISPPLTYHVGPQRAPLYRSYADTARRTSLYLPSQAEADVVQQLSPRWVVIKREGFLYTMPTAALTDYDPADADPLPLDPQTQRITYEGVVPVPGVEEADLYARAAAWVAKTYTPADTIARQPAQGELLVHGARPAVVYRDFQGVPRPVYAGAVRHTLTIYVKDGRYKYQLTNLMHTAGGTLNMKAGGPLEQEKANLFGYAGLGSQKPWTDLKIAATRDARHLMADLQVSMTGQKVVAPEKKKLVKPVKDPHDF
ncbi:DUF4468 domain-containing protein [Hymenobacter psoromatis]|uniref:DUF4468 domain-containing protein n=1 Tax=Hymenobacter psoromatis TaxID=1484116 RepID=UPI001CBFDFB1|nr:DUF4468 domain-containing protein [Hymenobacter psoromatis]